MGTQSGGSASGQGGLRRFAHRLVSSDYTLEAEQLQAEASEAGGEPLADCRDRAVVTVVGTLRTVTLRPREGVPALEAELWDGTGSIALVWLGRRDIAGIEPGRALRACGRVATHDGRRAIFNPRYELRPSGS